MISIEVASMASLDLEEYGSAGRLSFGIASPERSTKNANTAYSTEFLEWKFSHNGYGEPLIVVARENRKLIGSVAYGAFHLRQRESRVNARCSYDTFVLPQHRESGLFGKMLKEVDALLGSGTLGFNFPNSASRNGFKRYGWTPTKHIRQYSTIVTRILPVSPRVLHSDQVDTGTDILISWQAQTQPSGGQFDVEAWPSQEHLIWRCRRPNAETVLLNCRGSSALVSVHTRRGHREMRVLKCWSMESGARQMTDLRKMARSLECAFATITGDSIANIFNGVSRPILWTRRSSNAELFVRNAGPIESTTMNWSVEGVLFHTW